MAEKLQTYKTTTITQLKSYPTYQFHAFSNAKCSAEDTFLVCILETFQWLNSRMKDYVNPPADLMVPLPEQYHEFGMEKLHSFSLDLGFQIEVVYVQKKGIWSFRITEVDAGANLGSKTERKPVQGRTFSTEISYRLHRDGVEIGVRTICSEPAGTTENCEVFRPAIIRALIANKNVGLRYKYDIDGTVVDIASNANLDYLLRTIHDEKFDLPILLVAESGFEEEKTPVIPDKKEISSIRPAMGVTTDFSFNLGMGGMTAPKMQVNMSKVEGFQSAKEVSLKKEPKQKKKPVAAPKPAEKKRLPTIAADTIAGKLAAFCIVVTVKEKYFDKLKKELSVDFDYGELLILHHGNIVYQHSYSSYQNEIETYYRKLKQEIEILPKRSVYYFGSIRFTSEARLAEIQEKNESNLTNQEKIDLLTLENEELRQQLHDERKRNVDIGLTEEANRLNQKKIRQLEEERDELMEKYDDISVKYQQISGSYSKLSDIIAFYKSKSVIAADFPTETSKVCDWLERNFSEYFIVASSAKNLMKKYSGALDVALLCDGLLYLSGYARYKRGEIPEDILALYAEVNHWSVERSGTESVRLFPEIYSCKVGDQKYVLDYHIKYGVKSQQLIRVYFCWAENVRKIVIGSMPEHLPTVKQKT